MEPQSPRQIRPAANPSARSKPHSPRVEHLLTRTRRLSHSPVRRSPTLAWTDTLPGQLGRQLVEFVQVSDLGGQRGDLNILRP